MREADRLQRWALPALALLLGVGGEAAPASAQESPVTLRGTRPTSADVRELDVAVKYAAGRLRVAPAEDGELYSYHITYDADVFRPLNQWTMEDGTGRLRVGIRKDDGREEEAGWKRWWRRLLSLNFDLDLDAEGAGTLDLRLSPEVPTRLDLEVGAAENRLELGGLSLTELEVSTGASDTDLTFGSPNRVEMERLDIEAGAASFRAEGLGNARVRELSFGGGVGDVKLDFTGEWTGDMEASVGMALGSLRLVFPRDLGVRIHKEGFLTSVDAPGFVNTEGGGLESQNWSTAGYRLELSIRTAMGSVEIDRVQ